MFWEDRDRHRLTLQMHCHAGHPVRTIAEPLGGNSAGGWTRQLLRILPEVGTVHLVLSPTQSIPRQAFVPILAACFYRRHMIVDWRHRFAELQFESADRLTLGLLRRAARVLVATDSMAASLRRRGVQARSLRPAIDHDRLSKRTLDCVQPHILASLAVEGDGFSSPVGWRCLIQGFQLVKDKYPRAELTVLVDGLTSAQIATSRQQLPAGVALECASDDQIVTECFARADCFVNPAAIGNPVGSVVTALAIGLPVLSTNSGSIPEIISDGVNGLLFRSDQPSALADRVIQLVESPELVASLSIGAKKNAAAFAWPAASKSWLHACQPR
jgi:glycosyltransferase involved in cell wall biosynthesis